MKRGLIVILLLMVPFVIGNIDIDADKNKYNWGEDIIISGKISDIEVDKEWYVDSELVCGDDSIKGIGSMMQSPLILGQEVYFPGTFKIFPIKTRDIKGSCEIKLIIVDEDNVIVEEDVSESFIVTREMEGTFNVNKNTLQLGEELILTGDIKKVNGDGLKGIVRIILVDSSDKEWVVEQFETNDGKVEFKSNFEGTSILNNPGVYEINVFSADFYGNEMMFDDIGSFELVDEISVVLKANKANFVPGDKIEVSGEAKTIMQDNVENADVTIKFNQNVYKTMLKDGIFGYSFIVPEYNPSGKQDLVVNVEDDLGNHGETSLQLYVRAIPTRIDFEFNKEDVNPEEFIEITPLLYDQADDLILENLDVKIFDNNEREVYSSVARSNGDFKFEIGKFYEPGEWRVEASREELVGEKTFVINGIEDIEIELVNQTLFIKNVGNIEYDDLLNVEFSGGDYSFNRKKSIRPDETLIIDLAEEAPTGSYDIMITGAAVKGKDIVFKNVKVIGKEKKSFNFFYSILVMFLLAVFVYMLAFKRRMISGAKLREDKIFRKAKKDKEKFVKIKQEKAKKAPINFKNREESIKDFRKRVLKEIKETEEKQKPSKEFSSPDIKKDSGEGPKDGMFNMFS